jgi:hypothetical protein
MAWLKGFLPRVLACTGFGTITKSMLENLGRDLHESSWASLGTGGLTLLGTSRRGSGFATSGISASGGFTQSRTDIQSAPQVSRTTEARLADSPQRPTYNTSGFSVRASEPLDFRIRFPKPEPACSPCQGADIGSVMSHSKFPGDCEFGTKTSSVTLCNAQCASPSSFRFPLQFTNTESFALTFCPADI